MLRVSAIQLNLRDAATPQAFFDCARAPIERAVRDGAPLIVLPNLSVPIPRELSVVGESQARLRRQYERPPRAE